MVLDLDCFREDKGFSPQVIRDYQTKRFKDVGLVDTVVMKDQLWRQLRHKADSLNKLKNLCSKEIGEKMKKKEPMGADELPPKEMEDNLSDVTSDSLKTLTINQIKKLRDCLDKAIENNNTNLINTEAQRNDALREIGNHLHDSVPISNNEDENKVSFSIHLHLDLIFVI